MFFFILFRVVTAFACLYIYRSKGNIIINIFLGSIPYIQYYIYMYIFNVRCIYIWALTQTFNFEVLCLGGAWCRYWDIRRLQFSSVSVLYDVSSACLCLILNGAYFFCLDDLGIKRFCGSTWHARATCIIHLKNASDSMKCLSSNLSNPKAFKTRTQRMACRQLLFRLSF